jgi:hypothetical protein
MLQNLDLALQTKQVYLLVANDFVQVVVSRVVGSANFFRNADWPRE